MPDSTSNLSIDEQQAVAAAKRKEDDVAAAAQAAERRYRAPRVGGSHRRSGCRTQDPGRGSGA
jgi:hypothetical protein